MILMLGAPACFFASFGNLNSVGDTFADWSSEATLALEMPLYLVSCLAALVGLAALGTGFLTSRTRRPAPGTTPQTSPV
ncbi:MAG: hypothetical protein ACK5KO_09975 [Arachnia sp.]